MFTVEEILEKASEYQRSRISLVEFDRWFEDNWDDADNVDPLLLAARSAVDGALAQYYFDHIGEQAFRRELAAATCPFGRIAQLPADKTVCSTAVVYRFLKERPIPSPGLALVAASAALFVVPIAVDALRPSVISSASRVPVPVIHAAGMSF